MTVAELLGFDETDALLLALKPQLDRYRDTAERRQHLHDIKCLRLAPDLETFEALRRGGKVPRSRLDPYWLKAYGY